MQFLKALAILFEIPGLGQLRRDRGISVALDLKLRAGRSERVFAGLGRAAGLVEVSTETTFLSARA